MLEDVFMAAEEEKRNRTEFSAARLNTLTAMTAARCSEGIKWLVCFTGHERDAGGRRMRQTLDFHFLSQVVVVVDYC